MFGIMGTSACLCWPLLQQSHSGGTAAELSLLHWQLLDTGVETPRCVGGRFLNDVLCLVLLLPSCSSLHKLTRYPSLFIFLPDKTMLCSIISRIARYNLSFLIAVISVNILFQITVTAMWGWRAARCPTPRSPPAPATTRSTWGRSTPGSDRWTGDRGYHIHKGDISALNIFKTYFQLKDSAGGAWCPRNPVGPRPESHAQWLGVNMSSTQVVTKVLTQGRYAGGQVRSTPLLCAL